MMSMASEERTWRPRDAQALPESLLERARVSDCALGPEESCNCLKPVLRRPNRCWKRTVVPLGLERNVQRHTIWLSSGNIMRSPTALLRREIRCRCCPRHRRFMCSFPVSTATHPPPNDRR